MGDYKPSPDGGILFIHYGRNRLFGADGLAHVQSASVERAAVKKHHYSSPKIEEKAAREIDICLHCTRENCTGGDRCFRKPK